MQCDAESVAWTLYRGCGAHLGAGGKHSRRVVDARATDRETANTGKYTKTSVLRYIPSP